MCLVGIWLRMLSGVLCDRFPCNSPRSLALLALALAWWTMKDFNHQVPKIESGNSIHAFACVKRNYFSFCRLKLKSVSCTSNSMARMFSFRKCMRIHRTSNFSLQSLLQNQNLETILICIVVLCFPHNNIA